MQAILVLMAESAPTEMAPMYVPVVPSLVEESVKKVRLLSCHKKMIFSQR